MILVPYPKKLVFNDGTYTFEHCSYISIPEFDKESLFNIAKSLKEILEDILHLREYSIVVKKRKLQTQHISFEKNEDLIEEGYSLGISSEGILICYGTPTGAFRAVSTLKQLVFQFGNTIPYLYIMDEPDFKVRGVMLDISRDKIPTMETLFEIIDFLSDIKVNQIQLYIQGFSFAYESFTEVWENETPVTGEEIMILDRYCRERFIEFVPNQNSFGHMDAWLAREEFADLRVCPEGFTYEGEYFDASSLNPLDPRSLEFVENLYNDFLPYFSSDLFNVCCDETLELGQGKTTEICEKVGTGRVYLDFLLKIYELVKKHKKKMMFWGDIIVQYPELIPQIPKNVIALTWGYNPDQPNEEDCRKFYESGIPFYVCPGTASWNSITGKTGQMKANILTAAENGRKYGAIGLMNTDWGDRGHWQYLPVSYAGFVYGAALGWGLDQNKEMDIAAYLNLFIFRDYNNVMGRFVLDIGNYYLEEKKKINNQTGVVQILYREFEDRLIMEGYSKDDFIKVQDYVDSLYGELCKADMRCKDAELIFGEYKNALGFIRHGIKLGIVKLIDCKSDFTKTLLKEMLDDITILIKEHKELWLKRNRIGGLDNSKKHLEDLKSKYTDILKIT